MSSSIGGRISAILGKRTDFELSDSADVNPSESNHSVKVNQEDTAIVE